MFPTIHRNSMGEILYKLQMRMQFQPQANGIPSKTFKTHRSNYLLRRLLIPRSGIKSGTILKIKIQTWSWLQHQRLSLLLKNMIRWKSLIILKRWIAQSVTFFLNDYLLTNDRCLSLFLWGMILLQKSQPKLFQAIRLHVMHRSSSDSGNLLIVSTSESECPRFSNWTAQRGTVRFRAEKNH